VTEGTDGTVNPVRARIARLKAEREAKNPALAPVPEFDADLIPEAQYDETPEQTDLDRFIKGLDIVEVYNKWSKKKPVHPRAGQRESIKMSCPDPLHPDHNPSAWMNRDKNTWYCSSCDRGGDVYDIAAWYFGFPVPAYKMSKSFRELKVEMACGYGYNLTKLPGSREYVLVSPGEGRERDEPAGVPGSDKHLEEDSETPEKPDSDVRNSGSGQDGRSESDGSDPGAVVHLFGLPEEKFDYPTLDWKKLVPENTFLHEYMLACSRDDVAEEYHFWNGLLAIGFAIGREATLWDDIPVMGNLFICLLGGTGDGKSKSFRHLESLLEKALPYKRDEDESKGVHFVRSPASAESLIHQFSKPIMDPVNPKAVAYYAGIRGLVEYNELSGLIGRAGRGGNVLKPTLIEFYDGKRTISSSAITSGEKLARDAFASFHTTTQPNALKDLLQQSDADAGLLNRWVFVSGVPKERYSLGGIKVDTSASIPLLHNTRSWVGRGRELQMEEDAKIKWDEVFRIIKKHQEQDETAMLTRVDLLMKKLFLLFAANECAPIVSLNIVERVVKMYPYLLQTYGITSAKITSTTKKEMEEDVLRVAERLTKKNSAGMTMRELGRALARKNYDTEQLTKMIDILVKSDKLSENLSKAGTVGRPTRRFSYVA
jgi:hypothetical protein